MENNENIVTEEVTEAVEGTTEGTTEQVVQKPEKTFTQDEVNEIVRRRYSRAENKLRSENERNYGELMNVLRAGTGKQEVGEITEVFRDFYTQKGVQLPAKPVYSERDAEILAMAEAEDIIRGGYEDVVEEVDRLSSIGIDKMSAREKAQFKRLAEYRQGVERGMQLSKIGVPEEVYNGKEFKDFASKFTSSTPVTEIYGYFQSTRPTKKEHKPMGSMKSTEPADNGVKDFYTFDEARKFTKKDFDKNPALFKAVEASMLKWK